MDNKDYLKTDKSLFVDENGNSSNEFRIYGKSKNETVSQDITVNASNSNGNKTEPDSKLIAPDGFKSDADNFSSSFVETPSAIRPTYLPRFTEVSETYRMQNDPRPRPKTGTHTVEVAKTDAMSALDPTAESLEDAKVEKIVVTSAVVRNPEPVDESLTVLKFSTPVYEEEEAAAPLEKPVPVKEEIPASDDGLADFEEDVDEDLIVEPEAEEKPRNMTIPDPEPDPNISVVEFSHRSTAVVVAPRGSSDSDKTEKGKQRGEFESAIQRDDIKDRFLDTLMSIRVRLAASVILLLTMVLTDCLPHFGIDVFGWLGLGGVPSAKAVIDMQFSLCIFLFALPEVLKAFKLLIKGKFAPELFLVVTLPMIVVNDIVMANVKSVNYLTFGVIYGFSCLITVMASYSKTMGDFTSFKLVSRNVAKNVLDKRLTRELEYENIALDGVVDEYNSKTARMFRTAFVSNFFKRASESCENSVNTLMMIGIGVGVSFVTGAVTFLVSGYSLVLGVQSATFVLALSLPVFSILLHKLCYNHVCENAAAEESAFVGESSIYDGADVDVFVYEDTEIFGIEDVSLRKVHLYGNVGNTEKAMKQMYSLFSVVGGPLNFLFSSALVEKRSSAAEVVIKENGISGILDGHKICAGTEEYMKSHGVVIPDNDYRTNPLSTDSTRVMYGAEDGVVYVKFFIRYSFSEEFTMLLPELKDKKIVPLIYTRDPNITNDLLKILTLGEDIIRVMKKDTPHSEDETIYRRIDSGIVTHGDKGNAINMVLLAKRYALFQESFASIELISMIVSAVLAVVLTIGDMISLPATLLAIWQVVWCAVLHVRSKRFFRHNPEIAG